MNWIEFLTDNNIEYVSRGPNTRKGEVSIRCPWCGEADPSQHLGISLTSENWGCLRDPAHRGRSPVFLVGAILGCNSYQARQIVSQYNESDPESLGVWGVGESLGVNEPQLEPETLPDLKPIKSYGSTARFWRYLELRGFKPKRAVRYFRLKCCLTGRFKDRIIIPVYRGPMVAWTGRSLINPITAPRYLSSKSIKQTLFNEDELFDTPFSSADGKILFVVEGPFDAMKLDYHGREYGARATCTFGTGISTDQAVLLNSLRQHFEKVVVLYDQGALEPALQVMDWINAPNVILGQLPDGVKDPGELSKDQIHRLTQEL